MALFSLQAQQNGEVFQFTALDLLNLIDPSEQVNDEIIIRNRIFRRSSFVVIESAGSGAPANIPVVQIPQTTNGQTVFASNKLITDPQKLTVSLNGLDLHYGTDYNIVNSEVVMAYSVVKNSLQTDLLKFTHL